MYILLEVYAGCVIFSKKNAKYDLYFYFYQSRFFKKKQTKNKQFLTYFIANIFAEVYLKMTLASKEEQGNPINKLNIFLYIQD